MGKQSIADLKAMFAAEQVDQHVLEMLKMDDRKGVQQLIRQYERKKQKEDALRLKFQEMCLYEKQQWASGCRMIAGMDEAGRGPLAGPVVAAAVILPPDFELLGLNDSKQLSEKARNQYYEIITEQALSYHIAVVSNQIIDEINIFEATKRAMHEAVAHLNPKADFCLIDAVVLNDLPCPSLAITKGDAKSVSIAAASILAKTARDRLMRQLHDEYPQYDFASNMGYGTAHHLKMLEEHGPTPYHRQSFAPVRNVVHT